MSDDIIYIGKSVSEAAEVYCVDHGHIYVPNHDVLDWTKDWSKAVAAVEKHLAAEHPTPAWS